jgi:hypothetical protein
VVAGGQQNIASGGYSMAMGSYAEAKHYGSFVWNAGMYVTSSANDYSFTANAPGGVRFITSTAGFITGAFLAPNATAWSVLSDSNTKENFQPIDEKDILQKLEQMPVTTWNYKHDPSRRYIGPTAQDFMAAFGLGSDDKSINTLDATGVTFAAIKGMGEELKERDQQITSLRSEVTELNTKMEALEKKFETMSKRIDQFPPPPSR